MILCFSKMVKMKIQGIGNEWNFDYIITEKHEDFFGWLKEFLKGAFGYRELVDVEEREGKGYEMGQKLVSRFTDVHERYQCKDARVDVFFGKEKVFITITTDIKTRKKFLGVLKKMSFFAEPIKRETSQSF